MVIRLGDIVLDVGSHLGTFTRRALQVGAAQVIAFEIDPGSIACFSKTFEEEIAAGRVRLVPAAAWEDVGRLVLRGSGMTRRSCRPPAASTPLEAPRPQRSISRFVNSRWISSRWISKGPNVSAEGCAGDDIAIPAPSRDL